MSTRAISQLSPYLLSALSVPDSLLATGDRDTDSPPASHSFAQETDMQTRNYIMRKWLPSKGSRSTAVWVGGGCRQGGGVAWNVKDEKEFAKGTSWE